MFCFFSAVGAADTNGTAESAAQNVNTNIAGSSVNMGVADESSSVATFTDLNNELLDAQNEFIKSYRRNHSDVSEAYRNRQNVFVLGRDYAFNSTVDKKLKAGINIKKPIVIDGNGHTISGSNEARIFDVSAGYVTIKNVNLVHGHAYLGGAVRWSSPDGRLENSNLSDNLGTYGGAVLISRGPHVVNNNNFSNNYAFNDGTLYIVADDVNVTNNLFINNEAKGKPAIFNSRPIRNESNVFINNTKFIYGGSDVINVKESYIQSRYKGISKSLHAVEGNHKKQSSISSIYTSIDDGTDRLTLDILNKLFDKVFTNGHLIVYIDGKLVFNDTVGDDLSLFICNLSDYVLGGYEIKVVFTDSENNTNTFTEKITIS